MPRRKIPLVPGEYYHIYNRGNNRGGIFFEEENYLFFLRRMREYLISQTSEVFKTSEVSHPEASHPTAGQTSEVLETSEVLAVAPQISKTSKVFDHPRATVVAYCLMPNHFHLLVQPNDDALSHHLQNLLISYTKAVNKRYERVGALFQGAFQAKRIDSDEYLVLLSCYIHLNPVRSNFAAHPEDWAFSSYADYIGLRADTLVQPAAVLDRFPSRRAYQECVESSLRDNADLVRLEEK